MEGVRWAKGVSLAFAYAEDLGPAIGTNARDRSLSVLERDVLGVLDLHAGLALHTVCLWHMRFIWASPSKLVVFSTHVAPQNTRSGLRKNDCDMSRQWEFAPIEVASLKVLVISDTQVSTIAQRLPEKILKKGGSSDMTIHAGDLVPKSMLEQLSSISPLHTVRGNLHLEFGPLFPPLAS